MNSQGFPTKLVLQSLYIAWISPWQAAKQMKAIRKVAVDKLDATIR